MFRFFTIATRKLLIGPRTTMQLETIAPNIVLSCIGASPFLLLQLVSCVFSSSSLEEGTRAASAGGATISSGLGGPHPPQGSDG